MQGQVAAPSLDAAVPAAEAPARRRRGRLGELTPYLLLAPTLLFLAVFLAWPMAQALVLAFQDTDGALSTGPIQRMVGDVHFSEALKNTLLLTVIIVPTQVILALAMALLLMAGLRGAGVFLYFWAIPLAISDLAAGVVWLSIFTDRGYLNSLLVGLGLQESGFQFLSYENPFTAFLAIVLAETWRATAIVMIILVAGLQVIPKDYGEAAEVFGASLWNRIRYVTLPLLRPSLQVALILRTLLAFQVFSAVVALVGRNVPVLSGEAYYWYSQNRNTNVAAAFALLIMALSLANTLIYLRALRVRDEQVRAV